MRPVRALAPVLLVAAAAAAISGQQSQAEPSKASFERLCGSCHEPERSTSSRRTRDQWLQTVNSMVARGAEGSDEELLGVVEYLTREHGRVNVNLGSAADIALVLGLTPAEAAAIVEYRREHGTFEDTAAVARVPGIDVGKVESRRDAMVFGSRVASNGGRVPVAALTAANNWPSVNGGPQREAWARGEAMLSRSTVAGVRLIYARKLDNQNRGSLALTPPLILGNLISYRGFKEMLFVGGSSDVVYSIDAVLNRTLWTTKLPVGAQPPSAANAACPSGLMGIVMPGSSAAAIGAVAGIRRPGAFGAGAPAGRGPRSALVTGLASGFGRNGLLLAVGSDGHVHPLYQSNGAPFGTAISFVPAGSSVRGLNLHDNVLYASTIDGCGGPNALYALDLADENPAVKFETGSGAIGTAGPAIGTDGTVYAQLADGRGEVAGEYRDTVVALGPRDLKVKDFFTPSQTAVSSTGAVRGVTPVVFRWNGKEIVVAGSRDGRLFALDAPALGGSDHHTPLAQTSPIADIRGAFASWEDPDTGTRWIYVPLWGAARPGVTFPSANGAMSHGGVAAFTLDTRDGKTTLVPRWISRDMIQPAVGVANGLVFALSSGDETSRGVLYALDAATGRQLFTSGDAVTGRAGPGGRGLAVANGRVYFTTQDNTVYCFGIPTEH